MAYDGDDDLMGMGRVSKEGSIWACGRFLHPTGHMLSTQITVKVNSLEKKESGQFVAFDIMCYNSD